MMAASMMGIVPANKETEAQSVVLGEEPGPSGSRTTLFDGLQELFGVE